MASLTENKTIHCAFPPLLTKNNRSPFYGCCGKLFDKVEFDEQLQIRSKTSMCHFLAAMQESNQRRWHRGGADREAYRDCVYSLLVFPRLRAALPYVPLPALVERMAIVGFI